MTNITIMGVPPSSYTRTARMTCVEKGIAHDFTLPDQSDLASAHPFKKVPVLRDGDLTLYETQAICRYIDAKFDGPKLMPTDPVELARAEQSISTLNCYSYAALVPHYIFYYAFPKTPDGKPDKAGIAKDLPQVEHDLQLVEKRLQGNDWIAGSTFSLADLFWAPLVATVSKLPEGGTIIDRSPNLRRWLTKLEGRKSAEFLYPPPPQG